VEAIHIDGSKSKFDDVDLHILFRYRHFISELYGIFAVLIIVKLLENFKDRLVVAS
jgi:hypothetical protein